MISVPNFAIVSWHPCSVSIHVRQVNKLTRVVRLNIRTLQGDYDTTEENMKALQSVGQIIGEVLKQLDEERCKLVWP